MNTFINKIKSSFTKEKPSDILYPRNLEMIGGKLICLDLIPQGSTIVSGGVGNDVKFELELIRRKGIKVIGIDPTNTAQQYIQNLESAEPLLKTNYTYLKKALSHSNEPITLFFGDNDMMSSVSSQHRDTVEKNSFVCESITIDELLTKFNNVSYVKIDIEGAEYSILNKLENISVPQISIEFHHHCSTEYTVTESILLIQKLEKMGYDAIDYGAYHGRDRKLPEFSSKWSDLNCELLFIRK